MKELIGKTIKNVLIDAGHQYLQFVCTDGSMLTYITEGDCCSRSWIEHLSGVDGLRGATVTGVGENDPDDWGWNQCQESFWTEGDEDGDNIKVYSTKLQLLGRPDFEIEYRNASNGYYGGTIELCNSAVDEPLAELTDDF